MVWKVLRNSHHNNVTVHQNLAALWQCQKSEVAKVIKGMASKSCEIDPIPTTLLKDILPSIIKPITNIINISMQFGVFAKTWKVAAIKPLLKKIGLDLIPQNYCLVSNLSFLRKVLETLCAPPV